jgi:hypothetical protein
MKTITIATAMALSLMAGVAQAQSGMTLDAFVTQANRVPQNPTALLRSDARRLMAEAKTAFKQVGDEVRAARAAGRPTTSCPPERASVDVRQFLRFLNGIPQARRARMSVADGVRAWMADRYPCAS